MIMKTWNRAGTEIRLMLITFDNETRQLLWIVVGINFMPTKCFGNNKYV